MITWKYICNVPIWPDEKIVAMCQFQGDIVIVTDRGRTFYLSGDKLQEIHA